MKTKIIACILLMGLPLSSSAKMQKMPDIRSSFLLLQKNRVAYQNYNDSIFMKMNNNEWVDMRPAVPSSSEGNMSKITG